jgi:putative transposase
MNYESFNHAKTRLRYHLIFSTKYRHKSLLGIEKDVYNAVSYCESNSHFRVIDRAVDGGDHLHLVVAIRPNYSVGQTVKRLKQFTTNELWNSHSLHLKKFYWSGNRILWTHGYFASTVGEVSESVVLNYVRSQAK